MGRKKKGEFSRDNLLKNIEDDPKLKEKSAKPKEKPAKLKENPSKLNTKEQTRVEKAQIPKIVENEFEKDLIEIEGDCEEDVFDDNLAAADDMDELTRLMSVVEISNDEKALEGQINLAAYNQFLICLPAAIHPAIKGHLIERFKSLVTFPSNQNLENHPSITPAVIQTKLDTLSDAAGTSFSLCLAPPTYHCLKCEQVLVPQIGLATNVMVFDIGGPKIGTKYRYRCRSCTVAKYHLSYHPDQWGSPELGYQFYNAAHELVRASRVTWISRKQTEYFFASMHHVWASQEGNAEIYNEAFIDEAFKIQSSKLQLSGKPDWECRHYLHRKSLARGLRLYLIEMEMRSYNQTWTFPVYSAYDDSAYSAQLLIIDQYRIKNGYNHLCGDFCLSQGCIFKGHDMVHAIDGLWKLSYPHCMWYLPNKNIDFGLDIPPVCTSQPKQGCAFCSEHSDAAEKLGVPPSLQAFLKHCGVQGEEYSKEKSKQVESVLKMMHSEAKKFKHIKDADIESNNTPSYEQGTRATLRPRGGILNSKKMTGTQDYEPTCNKDTTGKQRLQKWTRGCFGIVNSAGFIRYWAPLFKSEGPAQVAVIVLTFLLTILGPSVPFVDWEKLVLSYDNMCHLDSLKMFKKPLPAKGNYAHIWEKITKVIDDLHWRNHVERCKITWNPDRIREIYPNANLVCCEQTFAWLGRFKKILNQMGKQHHHFFLHCLVKRRNAYIVRLYEEGRRNLIDIGCEVVENASDSEDDM